MDIEAYLRKFRLGDPEPSLKERVLASVAQAAPAPRRLWSRTRALSAAAAVLVAVGVGLWLLDLGRTGSPNPDRVSPSVVHSDPKDAPPTVPILAGRGRVVPVGGKSRFTVVDADRGHVRLDQGEVYVELPPGAGLRAEVETPAGKATALGTRFCAHYTGGAEKPILAVAILDGVVLISNAHGQTTADPGDVVLATQTSAPEKHSEASATAPRHHGACPFVTNLSLLYRPEVRAELKLTEEQKARLQTPGADDLRNICNFFRGLQALPRQEWAEKAGAFCTAQQQKAAQVLTAVQLARLQEIRLQQEGLFAVARPDVAGQLGLTEEQRASARDVLDQFAAAHRVLVAAPAKNIGKQLVELRRQAHEKLSALLTAGQSQAWQHMLGDLFTLERRPANRRDD